MHAGQLKSNGIRIAALCPQFTETDMVRKAQTLNAEGARRMMGDLPLLSADQVHLRCSLALLSS